jgi:hypothetical protein
MDNIEKAKRVRDLVNTLEHVKNLLNDMDEWDADKVNMYIGAYGIHTGPNLIPRSTYEVIKKSLINYASKAESELNELLQSK